MGHSKIYIRPTPMLRKQMGQMAKLFGLWDNSKLKNPVDRKLNPQPTIGDGVPDFLSQARGVRTRHVTRRQIVLNRHFTEIVSDILSISYSAELANYGINISSIETKAWNKGVRIYYSRLDNFDEDIHKKLVELEAPIRYEISQRRIVGRVPQVNFVYDKSLQLDAELCKAMERVDIEENVPCRDDSIAKRPDNEVVQVKMVGFQDERLISKKFVAPPDMDNTILGLNYPELYDESTVRLVRGRAQSDRLIKSKSYMVDPKPLFRETIPTNDETEDPAERVKSMKRFLISQKQKMEHKARVRRKQELLAQDRYKWVEKEGPEERKTGDISEDE